MRNGPGIPELMKFGELQWRSVAEGRMTLDQCADTLMRHFGNLPLIWRKLLWASIGWYESGFPRIVVGHKHAASLIATSIPAEYANDICFPWRVFWLDVPRGVLPMTKVGSVTGIGETEATGLFVLAPALGDTSGKSISVFITDSDAWVHETTLPPSEFLDRDPSLIKPLFENAKDLSIQCMDLGKQYNRMIQAVGRYVIGATMELTQHRPSHYCERGPDAIKRDPRGAPVTRTFVLTRDIKIDCRKIVRDYLTGATRSSPSVQSLVRGHWKRQPCGDHSLDRRWIQVEPYWRGPEDAPIALRNHVLMEAKA